MKELQDIQKQTEEMAEYIFRNAITHDTKFKEDCRSIARDLICVGYQKIDENKVVLTREEYEKLKRFEHQCFAMGAEIEESCQNGYLDGYKRGEERVREETADNLAAMIIDKHGYNPLTHEGDEDIEICLTASELYEICNKIKQNIKGEN